MGAGHWSEVEHLDWCDQVQRFKLNSLDSFFDSSSFTDLLAPWTSWLLRHAVKPVNVLDVRIIRAGLSLSACNSWGRGCGVMHVLGQTLKLLLH